MTHDATKSPCCDDAGSIAHHALRKVTAIIRSSVLDDVEQRLRDIHVPGVSITKVKGYGEYANFFRPDWSCQHARVEIYCRHERADEIARAIVDSAHTGGAGDGIVVVLPVESIFRIRTREVATTEDLGGCCCRDKAVDAGAPAPDAEG